MKLTQTRTNEEWLDALRGTLGQAEQNIAIHDLAYYIWGSQEVLAQSTQHTLQTPILHACVITRRSLNRKSQPTSTA